MPPGIRPLCLGLALALGASVEGAAGDDALAVYRWKARVLVLSAPDPADARLGAQRAVVAGAQAGLSERDLAVVEAVGPGPAAAALRRQLALPPQGFRAVLVGKDGEAKITASKPIPAERLLATIDAMPMRRDEMRARR